MTVQQMAHWHGCKNTAAEFPHVRSHSRHQGPAAARTWCRAFIGDTNIFIDSDLVVTQISQAHADALLKDSWVGVIAFLHMDKSINTCNFDDPTAEPYKLTDFSAAYFATGNVAIARKWLTKAGLFDTRFQLYGWEDLELGVRLKATA
jgi:hypothetical protein